MNDSPPAASPPLVKNERSFLLTLAAIQFTQMLDFMIMMPLGPKLIDAFGIDTRQFGLLVSSYTLAAGAAGLLATTYIDRFDRRKLMLGTYLLFIVATLCSGFAPSYGALLVARAAAGAFGGVLGSMTQTMIADVVPFERRGAAVGLVATSFALSTVAGVPLGLFLSTHVTFLGWRAPFFFIMLVACGTFLAAYKVLPSLTAHLDHPKEGHLLQQIFAVARQPNHLNAFAFIALLMMAGFTIFPYIALYVTTNTGQSESFLSLMYLCAGAATMLTAPKVGQLADRHGKLHVFRWLALASLIPLLALTHMGHTAGWLVLLNQTLFFVLMSGRTIPAMALVTASALPQVRGTFMSLVASVQMLAIGLASLLTGSVLTRDAAGRIERFDLVGWFAAACGLGAVWMIGRLRPAP